MIDLGPVLSGYYGHGQMVDLGEFEIYIQETNDRVFSQVVRDLAQPVGDRVLMGVTGASILRGGQNIERYLW